MLGIGPRGPLGRGEVEAGGATRLDERDAWVVLNAVDGIGPVTFGRLVAALGSAAEVLAAAGTAAGRARLTAPGGDADEGRPLLARSALNALILLAADPWPAVRAVRTAGVDVLTLADRGYPSRLRRVELPPPVLFLRGDAGALERPSAVAIVGTRRPTGAGRGMAALIGEAVGGLGASVISGLALGIDAAAHEAALRVGAHTVAVIGGGHDRLYPAAHHGLAARIVAAGGAVVSEFTPWTTPTKGTFPRRNRIISGLADATVVVEAGARSGALTTAAWALEQGRGLHVVPGRPGDPSVAGCLAFLREAGPEARVVAGIPELLEDLGLVRAAIAEAAAHGAPSTGGATVEGVLAGLGPAERAIAREIAAGRGSVDQVALATGLPGAAILGALTRLEVRGLVLEAFGRYLPTGPLANAAVLEGRASRVGGRAA